MGVTSSIFPDLSNTPLIDQVGVEERIDRLSKPSIKKESKAATLKLALKSEMASTNDRMTFLKLTKDRCRI